MAGLLQIYLDLMATLTCLTVVAFGGDSGCPITGQIFYPPCAPCDGTCENPFPICPLWCRAGCACPKGQVVKGQRCVDLGDCHLEGCTEGGKEYDHGETWTCSDGCNTCSCANGTVSSTKKACPPKKCPIKGQIWYSECAPCDGTCRNPVVECPAVCQPGCACPKGKVIKNGKKCVKPRRCPRKGCTEGGNTYKHGETWTCSDGCNQCRCKNGTVMSTNKACP